VELSSSRRACNPRGSGQRNAAVCSSFVGEHKALMNVPPRRGIPKWVTKRELQIMMRDSWIHTLRHLTNWFSCNGLASETHFNNGGRNNCRHDHGRGLDAKLLRHDF
jgi:hypothetical protein